MSLTNKDAAVILGMLARGDYNHDIAAWFGENPARIAEVKNGSHGSVAAAPSSDLPPKGAVGPKARRLSGRVQSAISALEKSGGNEDVLTMLKEASARFNTPSS